MNLLNAPKQARVDLLVLVSANLSKVVSCVCKLNCVKLHYLEMSFRLLSVLPAAKKFRKNDSVRK